VGLNLASGIATLGGGFLAQSVYGIGKTFFWPTMLAVASDRFPRTGAVAISIMGGVGMMSFGVFGSPGLGYAKDRFAAEALRTTDATVFEEYKGEKPSKFLPFIFGEATPIDPKKLGAVQQKLSEARAGERDPKAALETLTPQERSVIAASIEGDRKTLKADSAIPATMAVIYLILLIYFKSIGGYKPVHIDAQASSDPDTLHG